MTRLIVGDANYCTVPIYATWAQNTSQTSANNPASNPVFLRFDLGPHRVQSGTKKMRIRDVCPILRSKVHKRRYSVAIIPSGSNKTSKNGVLCFKFRCFPLAKVPDGQGRRN